MGVVLLDPAGRLFTVGHLRRADIGIHLVGAAQDADLDVEVWRSPSGPRRMLFHQATVAAAAKGCNGWEVNR
jgi:hypothetical protein